jgi:hypothetical protein
LSEEVEENSEESLREIFWNFAEQDGRGGPVPVKLTALLDRQIFEGYEVR